MFIEEGNTNVSRWASLIMLNVSAETSPSENKKIIMQDKTNKI